MISVKRLYEYTNSLSVLYVEDDDNLRNNMRDTLVELFKSVDVCEDGAIGLNQYISRIASNELPYDIVITDINMPNMNGIEMIREISKITPLQSFIVVSAHNEADYLLDLLNLGVSSFLIKPVQYDFMVNVLFKVSKYIINEELIKSHYKKIESLNEELSLQSQMLEKSNNELLEKNIALEKSMRIIEGMYQKDKLNHELKNMHENKVKKSVLKEIPDSDSVLYLEDIENRINTIVLQQQYKEIEPQHFKDLSSSIEIYSSSIPDKDIYISLKKSLNNLSFAVQSPPKSTQEAMVSKIFSMLESLFFIYPKWQLEWCNIDDSQFESFSNSMISDINTISDVWQFKV